MMIRHILPIAAILTAAAVLPQKAGAQAAQFLDYNPDARTAGMAGAGASLQASAFSMWNNTAAAALSGQTMDVAASYGLWQPSSAGNNAISAAGYGRVAEFMTLSAGIKYFSYKPYDITDSGSLITGSYTPKEMSAGVGLAFRILPILSVGANVNYVFSDIGGVKKAHAVSADFGAMLDLKFMRIGATVSNIGSKINYGGTSSYSLPANVRLGLGTTQYLGTAKKSALTASLQGGMLLSDTSFFAEAGLEYGWNGLVRVSAGYHYGSSTVPGIIPSYASVGAGVKIIGIYLDAAYLIGTSPDSPLTNSFSISVGYTF